MPTSLKKLVRRYERDNEISPVYVEQLSYAVNKLRRHLGRKPTTDDLKPKTVNRWLQSEKDHGRLSSRTCSNLRRSILTLWKSHDKKFDPNKVRKVKVPHRNPDAWNYDQFKRVADAASTITGVGKNGVPRSLMLSATVWFAYETGLRRRDIWDFSFSSLGGNLQTALTQHKVKRVHVFQITQQTFSDLERIHNILLARGSDSADQVLRWPASERQFYYWMRKARRIAGVEAGVKNRALQHIRRTGATAIEMDGGKAWQYLGHAAPGLDRKSYIDGTKTIVTTLPLVNRDTETSLSTAT